jgi:hypothetical protein
VLSQGAQSGLFATKEVLLKLLCAVVSTFFLPSQHTHCTTGSTVEDLLLFTRITVCVSMSGRESGASRKHPPGECNPFAANKRQGGPRSRHHGKNPKFPTNWQCFSLYAKFLNIDHTGYVRVTQVYGLPLSRYYFGFYSLTLYHVVAHDPARRCSYVLSIFTNVVCCLSLYHVVAHDPARRCHYVLSIFTNVVCCLSLYHVVAHDPARRCSYVLSIFTNVVCCLSLYHVVAHNPARRCRYMFFNFKNVVCCLSLYHVVAHDPDSCVYIGTKNCCELLTCTILDCFRTN